MYLEFIWFCILKQVFKKLINYLFFICFKLMLFCCIIHVDVVSTEDKELCSECPGDSKKRIRDDKQIL